ncbi:hypothetical protein QOZ80_1AG0021490 [Eleusine coracana subsp. coracana]|nr:hypothetical protein QOZ80_1AG0021490 [Eleusine coracana subsp. coracana]
MARAHPTSNSNNNGGVPALLVHAAWIAAAAAVCVALCTIHSCNRKPSLSFHRRRGSSSSSRSCASSSREISVNCAPVGDNGGAATACATPAAKVSPTPSDTPPKQEQAHAAEDDVFVGLRGDAADDDRGAVLWTKTIILGERCRVPTGDEAAMVRWKSYRPRQPQSVPVTRSNSFAGVGTCKRGADARY